MSVLRVDEAVGLTTTAHGGNLETRERVFGANRLPTIPPKSIFYFMLKALSDKIMILLSVVALVSLAIGIYEDVVTTDPAKKIHWIEGFSVLVAVIIIVLVSSVNDLNKERQFRNLNAKKEDRKIKGIRDGNTQLISIYDILVGDVLLLEPGDVVAADGVFISGMGLKCDESSATGESDTIKKGPSHDPFILSGSKVTEGIGKYVVTAVGEHSYFGKIMMAMRTENEDTPLQVKLDGLAERIAKLGTAFAILLFVLLFLKYIVTVLKTHGFGSDAATQESGSEVASQLVKILLTSIAIVAVAVPEGLPLAVTLSLAYATVRMMKDNCLVRVLSACETMGNATTICSDKTGTLTQNRMTVVAGVVGKNVMFAGDDEMGGNASKSGKLPGPSGPELLDRIMECAALNSSAFEAKNEETGEVELIGSKTEVALLQWADKAGFDYKLLRNNPNNTIVQVYPFSSERKSMATLVKVNKGDGSSPVYRIYAKGAPEVVMKYCDKVVLVPFSASPTAIKNQTNFSSDTTASPIQKRLGTSLRTICLAYREFSGEEFDALMNDILSHPLAFDQIVGQGLIMASVVGIEDPLRPGVIEAVKACKDAGVFVRMVTGDNVMTAKSIATQCGIYQRGGLVMEGEHFRKLSPERMLQVIPRLQVLARSSPLDKQILVSMLKQLGETVAVTGDGTNDGPALKMADIGFSMGIAGTEVAKEASSIILMDDSFSSVVKAILWGRSVNDSVKKFLQFQLSVNISAVLITLISALVDSDESSALTVVQLLWVNLVMDSLAALALATELPTNELLQRPPESKKAPLISFTMWKMILGQAVLQITINLILLFAGPYLFNFQALINAGGVMKTVVFNTFVILQLFSLINSRRIDNHVNVFVGILRNPPFYIIFIGVAAVQAILVEFGSAAFQTVHLNGVQWLVCIIAGSLTLPWGIILRLVSSTIFFRFVCQACTLKFWAKNFLSVCLFFFFFFFFLFFLYLSSSFPFYI
ncbi:PMCA-type calcium-translocating P-type ATPase [Chytriomyces cf. hyalinus JEL632]|nr:PMCA-type calcium-translocating P-type ATPase [Chytriomyces cf. hyalinus JEL632]